MSVTTVRRIRTEHGSHVEPSLDEDWTNLEKLQWLCAVVECDTGLTGVAVQPGGHSVQIVSRWVVNVPNSYSLNVGNSSAGSFTFNSAWTYLSGVIAGARAVRKQAEQ